MKNLLCQQVSNLFRHFGRKQLLEVAGMIEGGYQSRLQNVTCYNRVVFFIFKNTWICQCLSLLFWRVPIFKWVSAMKCKWWQWFSGYLSAKGFAVVFQAPGPGISLIFLTETWACSQCVPESLCPQCYAQYMWYCKWFHPAQGWALSPLCFCWKWNMVLPWHKNLNYILLYWAVYQFTLVTFKCSGVVIQLCSLIKRTKVGSI